MISVPSMPQQNKQSRRTEIQALSSISTWSIRSWLLRRRPNASILSLDASTIALDSLLICCRVSLFKCELDPVSRVTGIPGWYWILGIKCSDTTGVRLVYWNSALKSGQGHGPHTGILWYFVVDYHFSSEFFLLVITTTISSLLVVCNCLSSVILQGFMGYGSGTKSLGLE